MTFSGKYLLNIMRFAAVQGVSFDILLKESGYTLAQLLEEDTRVTADVYDRIVLIVVEETDDQLFGLHLGEYLNLSAAGLIGQITQSANTMKEALQYCCDFAALGCRAIPMSLKETKSGYQLIWKPDKHWQLKSPLIVKQTLEGMLSFTLREFHTLTLQHEYPLKMYFQFKKPLNLEEYERIFNCPLHFSQESTCMFFSKEQVMKPIITSNYSLLRVLVTHANEQLSLLKETNHFSQNVKKAIVNLLDPNFPTIEQVAANLNMTVRTMQRKLEKEHTTFKAILESLREDFAKDYINNKNLNIGDIAFLLNYADSSSFARSFKRWTGKTPIQFRTETL